MHRYSESLNISEVETERLRFIGARETTKIMIQRLRQRGIFIGANVS